MKIRKTGNLYQVVTEIGTVFQDHDLKTVKTWMAEHHEGDLTGDLQYSIMRHDTVAKRYGKTINW